MQSLSNSISAEQITPSVDGSLDIEAALTQRDVNPPPRLNDLPLDKTIASYLKSDSSILASISGSQQEHENFVEFTAPPRLDDFLADKIISSNPNVRPNGPPTTPTSLAGGQREHEGFVTRNPPPRLEEFPPDETISSHPDFKPKGPPNTPPSLSGGQREHERSFVIRDETVSPDISSEKRDHTSSSLKFDEPNSEEVSLSINPNIERQQEDIYSTLGNTLVSDTTIEKRGWVTKFLGLDEPITNNHAKRQYHEFIPVNINHSFASHTAQGKYLTARATYERCDACWILFAIPALLALALAYGMFYYSVRTIKDWINACIKKRKEKKRADLEAQKLKVTYSASRNTSPNPTSNLPTQRVQQPRSQSMTRWPLEGGSAARQIADRAAAKSLARERPLAPYIRASAPTLTTIAEAPRMPTPPPAYGPQEEYIPSRPFTTQATRE
ncbi:hypothetical protein B7463_g2313, partial [Scytalidium lignicola]